MPKDKREKKHDRKPAFTLVTSRTQAHLNQLQAEDKTNLTNVSRGKSSYSKKLGLDDTLSNCLIKHALSTNAKITLLDAGCGACRAIDELLSDACLDNMLESCTGISLHYFTNVKDVMQKHGSRFVYYQGKAQDVLPKMHHCFDIIVDVWGAYSYAKDKIKLLKQYHQALKPGGVAYVYLGGTRRVPRIRQSMDSCTTISLYELLEQTCSKTFSYYKTTSGDYQLTMRKIAERFPLDQYSVISSKEAPTLHRSLSLFKLREGNAVSFNHTQYEKDEQQPMVLRSLPYRK